MWDDVEKDLQTSLDRWSKLAVLIERIEVRSRQVAQDEDKFQKILQDFNTALPGMYQIDQVDVAIISDDLKIVGKHVDSTRSLIEDQCNEIVKDTTEDFKKFADVLLSMKSLFDRYRRLGGNQIEQLSKRLESNKERLQELNGKADVKGMDIDKLQEAISKDTKEIAEQTNRDWLIKETVLTEYVMFQETQFQLTKVFQEWSRTKMKYSELHSNNWGQLINALHDMPLSRHT
ncbi:MVP1 [Cyberlindnera jadinii]|nr:MVP1 [Cyberlindnera jadinii]